MPILKMDVLGIFGKAVLNPKPCWMNRLYFAAWPICNLAQLVIQWAIINAASSFEVTP